MLAASPVLAAELPAALGPAPDPAALAAGYVAAPPTPAETAGRGDLVRAAAPPSARAEAPGSRDLVRVLQELAFELRAQRTGRAPLARRSAAGAARQVRVEQVDLRIDESGDLFRALEGLAEAAGEPL